MHGGKSLQGTASPRYRHGHYTKGQIERRRRLRSLLKNPGEMDLKDWARILSDPSNPDFTEAYKAAVALAHGEPDET